MPTPTVPRASRVYQGNSRHRSRPTTDDDQPIRIPCAAAHTSQTTGMATAVTRLITRITPGLDRSSRADSEKAIPSATISPIRPATSVRTAATRYTTTSSRRPTAGRQPAHVRERMTCRNGRASSCGGVPGGSQRGG
jgi:hypothetical protein